MSPFFIRSLIICLVLLSGAAALSWEVIWQIKSSLALGVSAWGSALTLAVVTGGMCLGALGMGLVLQTRFAGHPARSYAILELAIGVSGFFLSDLLRLVETVDTSVYASAPQYATAIHIFGIAISLGLPSLAMGATLPVFGLVAKSSGTSIALLYGFNTLGAAVGVLITAFVLIPSFGIMHLIWIVAGLNLLVALISWIIDPAIASAKQLRTENEPSLAPTLSPAMATAIVCVTGFSTFALEVAWFRSLTAAFESTTSAFAIMLTSVLAALGAGARMVMWLRRMNFSIGVLLAWSGILTLFVTPVIERFDLVLRFAPEHPFLSFTGWFLATSCVLGAPMLLLGTSLPWILDEQNNSRRWGKLYGLNSFFGVVGSISAAWIFLPLIGFARLAWLSGALLTGAGLLSSPRERRGKLFVLAAIALVTAITFESGVGTTRAQGISHYNTQHVAYRVIESYDGPDVTASVVEYANGVRVLFIDGFEATMQAGKSAERQFVHYMPWMGHLPMLLHPDPVNALVICFGTGQTANAVRYENPKQLDLVDVNPNIFKLAHDFPVNDDVLNDPRVHPIVMDGRAYLRRTRKTYDVITLEPMPPTFAGVNALYSREFYLLARKRLGVRGVIAQWVPFHLLTAYYTASIVRTFQDVFPNAILWIDPLSTTGIIVGSTDDTVNLERSWPGFSRPAAKRDLSENEVRAAVALDRTRLQQFAVKGKIITDDNQLLAYGPATYTPSDMGK